MIHDLKTLDIYFDAIARGDKTFEVRKNDRAFQKGDIVCLRRCFHIPMKGIQEDPDAKPVMFKIKYILQGGQFGINPLYCVMQLEPLDDRK